jgi:hypothetical protein
MEIFKKENGYAVNFVVGNLGSVYYVRGERPAMFTNSKGYVVVRFGPRHKWKLSLHHLVANAFVHNPRPDIFKQVDHIDRDKSNNAASNLRWVNCKLNQRNRSTSKRETQLSFGALYEELTGTRPLWL